MRRRRQCEKGYTLVEALIVVGIIGLIVAISIPSLRRSRMRAAMLDTVRVFEQAAAVSRISAIKRGTNVCLSILPDGSGRHQLSRFTAWFDTNGNEVQDTGEELVGSWQIRNTSEWSFQETADGTRKMHVLNQSGGGSARGIVYQPNGMAIAAHNQAPGIGEGAFEYFIWQGGRKWNTFRISTFGGAGTIRVQMNIPGTSDWDDNFAHWEYY